MLEENKNIEINDEELKKVSGGKCRGDDILDIDSSNPLCPKCGGKIHSTGSFGNVDFYECELCHQEFCRFTVGDNWYYFE